MKLYLVFIKLPASCIWTCHTTWSTTDAWRADELAKQIADGGAYCAKVVPVTLPMEVDGLKAELSDGTVYRPVDDAKD